MENISVMVITKNEEKNLARCLESIKDFAEIVVVDSGSSDATVEIAKRFTSKVSVREFDDFSAQKNFALSRCSNHWVLSLDADEAVSDSLKEKLRSLQPESLSGYRIKRVTYIFGKELRYGGHALDKPLRLFDKRKAVFEQPIHEFVRISGDIASIDEPLLHYSSQNVVQYVSKLNLYTDLEAQFLLLRNVPFSSSKLLVRPLAKFIKLYVFQRGFLDSFEGFAFYALSAFYDFVKWLKYWEKLRNRCPHC